MSEHTIVVPDVATGKAVAQKLFVEFEIQNEIDTLTVNSVITLSQTLLTGNIIRVSKLGTVNAVIHVLLDEESPALIIQGEDINVNGVKYAEVRNTATLKKYYSQKTVMVGGNNQFNDVFINRYGALRTTFESGTPQIDSVGRVKTTDKTVIGSYDFIRVEDPNDFLKVMSGGGSTTFNVNAALLLLSTALGLTDSVQIYSNLYHYHVNGSSLLFNMKIVVGDSGKTNVIRDWGYFDTRDGIIFRLNGTQFQIVLRSFVSGVVVETAINQQNFNGDVFDGSGSRSNNSRATFNPATVNSYWVDIDSSICIRCGIVDNGNRIVMHTFDNTKSGVTNLLRKYSLPISVKQENTGLPASGSEIRLISSTVMTESSYKPDDGNIGSASTDIAATITPGSWQPVFTIQPQAFTHGYIIAVLISLYAHLLGVDKPVRVGIFANAVLTGAVFNPVSALGEADTSATSFTGGAKLYEVFITGTEQIEFKTISNNTKKYLKNLADGSQQSFTIAAKTFDANDVDVFATFNWEEIDI